MFSLFVRSPSFTLIGSGSMQWRLEEGFVGIFLYSTAVCSLKSEGKLADHEKWMHSSSLNHSAVGRRCLKFLFFLFLFPSEFNEKKPKKIYFKKRHYGSVCKDTCWPTVQAWWPEFDFWNPLHKVSSHLHTGSLHSPYHTYVHVRARTHTL